MMEEEKDKKSFVLGFDSFHDVQIDPNWSRLDCLAAVAECASYLLEQKMSAKEKRIKEDDDRLKRLIKQRFFYQEKNKIKMKHIKNRQQTRKRGRSRLCRVSTPPLATDDQENQENFDKDEEEDEEGNTNKRLKKNTDPSSSSSRQLPGEYRTTLERYADPSSSSSRQLPREYRTALERYTVGKRIEELNLVLRKNIYKTDISPTHARLSLPKNKQEHSFLTEEEENYLKLSDLNDKGNKVMNSMEVDVIEPSLEICKLELKNWAISKEMYVLTKYWNDLVKRNSIQINETIDVWTVRVDQKLWFILVRVPETAPEQD